MVSSIFEQTPGGLNSARVSQGDKQQKILLTNIKKLTTMTNRGLRVWFGFGLAFGAEPHLLILPMTLRCGGRSELLVATKAISFDLRRQTAKERGK
jgi:hypothetical protein